ncbi:hypothetical protein ASZ78_005846 [Callipepla squamata]|uniref:C-type lectin domain-containing protein n=1 Tax=Callipepla squamata TaxID=9009 RepID=A0A226MUC1_CALSU|nr:hypothetical protein ASZ78_005846 [Callipepla squamata]
MFLSGAGNSTAKHRNARFLFDFFDRSKSEQNVITNPSQQDSSAKQICRSRCQKGWISYNGLCYLFIQERMTWMEAEGSLLKWSDGSLISFVQRPLSSIFHAVGGLINSLFNVKICLMVNIGGDV